jgi:hypothetical protein
MQEPPCQNPNQLQVEAREGAVNKASNAGIKIWVLLKARWRVTDRSCSSGERNLTTTYNNVSIQSDAARPWRLADR